MSFSISNQSPTSNSRPTYSVSKPSVSNTSSQAKSQSSSSLSQALGQILSSLGSSSQPSSSTSASAQTGTASSLREQKQAKKEAEASSVGSVVGGAIGSCIAPGVGTTIGSFIGGILGRLTTMFGGGKHKDQLARDDMRTGLQQVGLIDQNYNIKLADGTLYDIGKDGGFRIPNTDGTQRRAYETDMSNPLTAQVIGWVNPLATMLAGGNEKIRTDLAGYLTNAALSNAKTLEEAQANALSFYTQLGVTPDNASQVLEHIAQSGAVGEDVLAAFANGLQTLFTPPAQTAQEGAASTPTANVSPTNEPAQSPAENSAVA